MATHTEQSRSVDLHQTDMIYRDGSTVWIAIQSSSDGRQTINKNYDRDPIVNRLRRDQSSIVPRSGPSSAWNCLHSIGRRSTDDQDHDRGPIVARLWPDRGMIMVQLKQKLRLTYLNSGSHDTARGNRIHDPAKPLSRPPLSPTILGQFSSLNPMYFPPLCWKF